MCDSIQSLFCQPDNYSHDYGDILSPLMLIRSLFKVTQDVYKGVAVAALYNGILWKFNICVLEERNII